MTRSVGVPVTEVLFEKLPTLGAHRFFLDTFPQSRGLDERLKSQLQKNNHWLLEEAEHLKIPIWHLAATQAVTSSSVELSVFDKFVAHGHQRNATRYPYDIAQFNRARFRLLTSQLADDAVLGISSLMETTEGRLAHLPMMDFCCPKTDRSLKAICKLLQKIDAPFGVIVDSGHSYHYYGWKLVGHEAWIKFMGLSLLLAPLTDSRYIGHRLAEGQCRLRIFSHNRPVPMVIAEFAY